MGKALYFFALLGSAALGITAGFYDIKPSSALIFAPASLPSVASTAFDGRLIGAPNGTAFTFETESPYDKSRVRYLLHYTEETQVVDSKNPGSARIGAIGHLAGKDLRVQIASAPDGLFARTIIVIK